VAFGMVRGTIQGLKYWGVLSGLQNDKGINIIFFSPFFKKLFIFACFMCTFFRARFVVVLI